MSLLSKIKNRLMYLQWQLTRKGARDEEPPWMATAGPWVNPEPFLWEILQSVPGGSFLEIGIGMKANVNRLRVMADAGVRYHASDFQHVCDEHERAIRATPGLEHLDYRFLGNNRGGTYSWTLFDLLREKEQFDVIYLDGHHTFYVDCPAVVLGHLLLKPSGIFVLDDIPWTLSFHERAVATSFPEWKFFRKVYDNSEYSPEQQLLPHMQMMAETFLVENFNYSKIERHSTSEWWALRKPEQAGGASRSYLSDEHLLEEARGAGQATA